MGFPPQGAPLAPLKWLYMSLYQEELQLTTGASDENLPDVVLPSYPGRTLKNARAVFKWRALENTNAAVNKLDGAQSIRVKIAGGAWGVDDIACIDFIDDLFTVAASTREMGDMTEGENELNSEVDSMGATYNFRWEDSLVDQDNLQFNDVQMGLIVELQ